MSKRTSRPSLAQPVRQLLELDHDPIRVTRGRATEEIVVDDPPHVHQPLVQSIIDEINGRGDCPSTGTAALGTARAMDRILADVTSL